MMPTPATPHTVAVVTVTRKFAVPVSQTWSGWIAECFLDRFLYSFDDRDDDGSGDVCIEGSVSADSLRRVVTRSEPEFARLTGCGTWTVNLT